MARVKPVRLVLPGGAALGGNTDRDDERRVACRPLAAVSVRTRCRSWYRRFLRWARVLVRTIWNRLSDVKVLLEVLVALVALIGAILALLGFRK